MTETREALRARFAPPAPPRIPLRRYGLQIGTFAVGAVIWVIFAVSAPETFLHYDIYTSLMSTVPFSAVMALVLTMLIVAREIDLSFPSVMAVGTLCFWLVYHASGNVLAALLAALASGAAAGLLNGLIVVLIGIPSLVATIGTMFFWRGIVLVATGGEGKSTVETQGSVVYSALVGRTPGQIPGQMIWLVGGAVFLWIVLNRSKFGAHVYLVGDNTESARMMGVKTGRARIVLFAMMGTVAAFAGVLTTEELSFFWPTVGDGQLLPTLSAVFLGGTSVFGGTGTIFGTALAAFIIGVIEPGIVAVGLTGLWTQVLYGAIIVLSLALQAVLRRRVSR